MTAFYKNTSLAFQVRNCSSSNCADGIWQNVNLSNINLTGRYFQYKVNFTSPDSSITPRLFNTSIDYNLINSAPSITIVSPTSTNYDYNHSINFNFTASDINGNLESCWYNLDDGSNITLPSCANTTLLPSNGAHTLNLFANDSFGLISNTSVSFSVINTAPSLALSSPQDGQTYGYNDSLEINFSVGDINGNLNSCWYNLDDGANVTLVNCQNSSFDIVNGDHTINLFANDSFGLVATAYANFSVNVGSPSISLQSPINSYLNNSNITFVYTPSDIDLDACELWGNWSGVWRVNQTEFNPANYSQNVFYLILNDGVYKWNIRCNDIYGNSAFNGNKTFVVDTIAPKVSISQPFGAKTSKTVSASWTINEINPSVCWYNVYRGVSVEISNTTVNCSILSTSFDVTVDSTSFVFNFYINDSAGNVNSSNSSFSVDSSTSVVIVNPPSGGGGGSSGGGSFPASPVSGINKIEISGISDLIVNGGESKKIVVNVRNAGTNFLNGCSLKISSDLDVFSVDSGKIDLSAGEMHDFTINMNVPEDVQDGKYSTNVSLSCTEMEKTESFSVEAIKKELGFELINVKRISGEEVSVSYYLEEFSEMNQEVQLQFLLFNTEKEKVAEVTESKSLSASTKEEFTTIIPIVSSLRGDLSLLVNLNSETYSTFVQEDIVLGSPISGFAIFGDDGSTDNILSFSLIAGFLIFAGFMVWRIVRIYKKRKHSGRLIKIFRHKFGMD